MPGVYFTIAAVLPFVKAMSFHAPLMNWYRGVSPKTQRSRPFGNATLNPRSRPIAVVAFSFADTTGPRNTGPTGAAADSVIGTAWPR